MYKPNSLLRTGCAIAALAVTACSPPEERPPNLVIIFTDDQGYADVGAYGGVGESHAHHVMTGCHADLGCGTFEGVLKAEHAPGGQTTVTASGHGTGDFHTLQIRILMLERGNSSIFDWEGVIF